MNGIQLRFDKPSYNTTNKHTSWTKLESYTVVDTDTIHLVSSLFNIIQEQILKEVILLRI